MESVLILEEALMGQWICRLWTEQDGQDIIEYSLLICFIALAVMWFIGSTRPAVNGVWTNGNSHLTEALDAATTN